LVALDSGGDDVTDEPCSCEKWLTTAELIEELQRIDPSGRRRVTIYDHPDFEPLRPRDIGITGVNKELVIALQHADWTAHPDD
jgi:hypothetical protein